MNTAVKPPKTSTPGGKGSTKSKAKGINVNLLGPIDKTYLCQKICAAEAIGIVKLAKAAKLGYYLSPQLAVDAMIMLDYHWFEGKWRYIPEVSFDMGHSPPKAILSPIQVFPPNYPYWGYPRKGTKRPDVIIIDGENSHALDQANIIRVIEIKFGKDSLRPRQQKDYERIAGNRNNFTLMTDDDCECKDDKDKKKNDKSESATDPKLVDTWDELMEGLRNKHLPIYAPKPHPAVVPVVPKPPKPSSKPKPVYSQYGGAPLGSPYTPMKTRPAGVPANAIQVTNKETGGYEWVIPTLQVIGAVAVTAVIVVAFATGVGEVATVLAVGARFVIAGAPRLALRYGAGFAAAAGAASAAHAADDFKYID
jgi:hypothetical protein